jgi:hypothetical protein
MKLLLSFSILLLINCSLFFDDAYIDSGFKNGPGAFTIKSITVIDNRDLADNCGNHFTTPDQPETYFYSSEQKIIPTPTTTECCDSILHNIVRR